MLIHHFLFFFFSTEAKGYGPLLGGEYLALTIPTSLNDYILIQYILLSIQQYFGILERMELIEKGQNRRSQCSKMTTKYSSRGLGSGHVFIQEICWQVNGFYEFVNSFF